MKKYIIFGISVIVVGAYSMLAQRDIEGNVYKVGLSLPLSGNFASTGEDVLSGIQLAVKHIKAERGVEIHLVVEDSKADAKSAVDVAHKMLDVDKLPMVISGPGSSANLAAAPIYEQRRTFFFVVSQTPKLNNAGEYIYKFSPDVPKEAVLMAKHLHETGIKHLGIIFDSSSDTSFTINEVLLKEFMVGSSTATSEAVDAKTSNDFRSSLTKIKAANVDALFLAPGPDKVIAQVINQARELGINVPLFSWSPLETKTIIDSAKQNAEGIVYTALPFSCEYGNTQMKSYCDEFEKAYPGKNPLHFGPQAYDALVLYINAILTAGLKPEDLQSQDGKDRLRYELAKIKNYEGVSGDISLDEKGNITEKAFQLRQVKDGKFIPYIK
ncbi:MAG TPA: penicillin-binding protein activator [Patescibacteria group bacterium]|nr:penicillin-binding protein activator [Patescibacteria group bacterium]